MILRPRSEQWKKPSDRKELKPETFPPDNLSKSQFLKSLNLQSSSPGQSQQSISGYIHIDQNEIISNPPKEKVATKCNCTPEKGCAEHCLNYLTGVECHPKSCPAKDQCQNQKFRHGPLQKTEIRMTEMKGHGLFAMEAIPIGDLVVEYVGQVIDDKEFKKRFQVSKKTGKFFFMSLDEGYYIDSGIKGNKARFVNHSCDPNTQARKWTVQKKNRLGLFAIKNIPRVSLIWFDSAGFS